MAEREWTCVLCGHEFESEEEPSRCPACLSGRGLEAKAPGRRTAKRAQTSEGGANPSGGRFGVIAAALAVVLVGAGIASYVMMADSGGPGDAPAVDGPAATTGRAPVAAEPGTVDPALAPDPSAPGPAVTRLAEPLKGNAQGVRDKVAALVKSGKLRPHDIDEEFSRAPLTAEDIAIAMESGVVEPLTSLEMAALVAAVAKGAGVEAGVVEDPKARHGALSLTRKRFLTSIAGKPFAAFPGDAASASAELVPTPTPLLRAFFQGLYALSSAGDENFKKSNDHLAHALKLAPMEPSLIFMKGQIAVISGMVRFGIEDLERALAQRDDALGRYNLGVAYVQAQDFVPAQAALRRAIELDPQFAPAWLALANLHLARIPITPEDRRDGLILSANEAVEKARVIEPEAEGISVLSAQILLAQDDERGALTLLDEAVRAHPDRPQPYLLLGTLLANKGNYAELVAYLRKGFEALPGDEQIRHLLIAGYLAQGHVDDAEKVLARALEASPNKRGLRAELAGLLANRGDKDGAQRLLEEEIQRFPDSDKAQLLLGQLDLDAKRFDKAAERLDAVLEQQPGSFEALTLRYITALRQKDEKGADALLRRIATAQPNGRALVAQLLLEQGLYDEGIAILEKILKDRPGSPSESLMLVAAYTSVGREEEAQRVRAAVLSVVDDPQFRAQLDATVEEARRIRAAIAAQGGAGPDGETPPADGGLEPPEEGETDASAEGSEPAEGAEGDDGEEDDDEGGIPKLDVDFGGKIGAPGGPAGFELPDPKIPRAPGSGGGGIPKLDIPGAP